MVERKPVQSSNIISAGYDPETRQFEIEFKSGAYTHADVSPETYQAFLDAPSKGKFYAANIKGKFAHRKLGQ